jgi:hypothetical protein
MIVTMFSTGAERHLNMELFSQMRGECVNVNMTF